MVVRDLAGINQLRAALHAFYGFLNATEFTSLIAIVLITVAWNTLEIHAQT